MDCPEGGGRLASAWAGAVRAYFLRRCARAEDAEDLAQDTLCALISGLGRYRGECSEATWVYAVCRKVFAGWLRRRDREARLAEAARSEALAGDKDAGGGVGGMAGIPEVEDRLALGLDLDAALAGLRSAELRLYRLHYAEGRKVAEIAAILGRPEGTVKYLLHGLRLRLREILGAGPAGPGLSRR